MILHGDGSMNTFVKSGLIPSSEYQVEGRPQNVLGLPRVHNVTVNGKFDLALANPPPFSIKLTEDDKNGGSGRLLWRPRIIRGPVHRAMVAAT